MQKFIQLKNSFSFSLFKLAFLFIIFSCLTFPQNYGKVNHAFHNTFVFGVDGGVTLPQTDYEKSKLGYSVRLNGEYFFKTNSIHLFGIKLKLGSEDVNGEDNRATISNNDEPNPRPIPPSFNTSIFSAGIAATYSISVNDFFFPYVSVGYSNLWIDPKDDNSNPAYGNSIDLYSKSVPAYSFEVGCRFLVSDQFSINISGNPYIPVTDYIDDVSAASQDDAFTSLLIGFSYSPFLDSDPDADGISGSSDLCPEVPEDIDGFEDEDGCPDPDNDNDGVLDIHDQCPNDSEDKDNFKDEDGCPDFDNDNDGITDLKDKCPDEPEDIDGFEDEDGCPDYDNDNDGILDANDKCINEAEDYNGIEDKDGCPDGVSMIGSNRYILLADDIFSSNSAKIKIDGKKYLDEVMAVIQKSTHKKWRIEGHMDSSGDARYLRTLSLDRAKAVLEYFTYFGGLERENFKVFGLGDKSPVADNRSEEGKKKNRRIEIIAED